VPNLVQVSEHLEYERKRFRTDGAEAPPKGYTSVNEVMTSVAQRLGGQSKDDGLRERFMQKIRFRRRWAKSGANIFMPSSMALADEDEQTHQQVIALALRMSMDHEASLKGQQAPTEQREELAASAELEQAARSAEPKTTLTSEMGPMPTMTSLLGPMPTFASDLDHRKPDFGVPEGWQSESGIMVCDSENGSWSTSTPVHVVRYPAGSNDEEEGLLNPRSPPPEHDPEGDVKLGRRANLVPPQVPSLAWTQTTLVSIDSDRGTDRSRGKVNFTADEHDDEGEEIAVRPSMRGHPRRHRRRGASGWLPLNVAGDGTESGEVSEADQRRLLQELQRIGREMVQKQRRQPRVIPSRQSSSSGEDAWSSLQSQRVDALFRGNDQKLTWKTAFLLTDLAEAVDGNDPRARAIARWRVAKHRVIWAVRMIQDAVQEHQKLVEITEREARLKSKTQSFSIRHDAASMVEMYHTILNATRSAYKEMYEARALPEGPFRVLMDSLELQEEAVDGELRSVPNVPGDRHLQELLRTLPSASHEEQRARSFSVAWQYVKVNGNRTQGSRCFDRLYRRCFVEGEWWQLQHDVLTVLAFIMTNECITELEVIQKFEDEVKMPMLTITENAKVDVLYHLMLHSPAMFGLLEHLLCLRLIIDFQSRLLNELVKDGVLPEEDAEQLRKRALQPVSLALEYFVPSRDQLSLAGCVPCRGSAAPGSATCSYTLNGGLRAKPDAPTAK